MASDAKKAVAVMMAVAIVVVIFPTLSATVNNNSGAVDATNETLTAQNDTYVDLKGYNIHSGSETVYWYNSTSSSYETTTDYTLNESGGAILVNTSNKIAAGDDIKVSYTYQATDGATTTIIGLVTTFLALLTLVYVGNELTDKL